MAKSSKVTALWGGFDTYGRKVEVALSSNGNYYDRVAEFNGYAVAFGKWKITTPSFSSDGRMEWGFNYLTKYVDLSDCKYRLPI